MLSSLIPSREVWSAAEDEPEKDDGPVYFSYFASAALCKLHESRAVGFALPLMIYDRQSSHIT